MEDNVAVKIGRDTKQRDSNIEFFRIITMIMIIAHHYVVNSGLTLVEGSIYTNPHSWRSLFLLIFGAWGKIGINCFVLISGYFMCKSNITARKFAKLLFEVMFYRIVINLIFWISGYVEFSTVTFINVLIPVKVIDKGFTSAYLVFFLTIPFLNILVKHMSEKQHVRLLLLSAFLYVFLGTFKPVVSVTMNYVSWFIVLYFISSYIRLYSKKIFTNTKVWGWLTVSCVMVSAMSVVACAWVGTVINRKDIAYIFVTDSNTLLAVLTSVCAFLFFKNLKMRYSRFINTVAASTFGVLLIHANSDTMRQWLWNDILDNVGHYNSSFMVIHAVGSVLCIFIVCTFIDFIRIKFIEIPFFKAWDKYWDRFLVWFQNKEDNILEKLHIER